MASTVAGWIPASIRQRILRFALDKIGILEGSTIDLDNLNITLGTKNMLTFRDVGLNVANLAQLAKLPPAIRLESARILFLRITAPATLTGIQFEIEGIEVVAHVEEQDDAATQQGGQAGGYRRTAGSAQSPSHRKTARRTGSPPPHFFGGDKMPTTEDLARSFLAEEPLEERRELEARAAANDIPVEESFVSQSSDSSGSGVGASPGLPSFLAGYIQSIVDSLEARVTDIHIRLNIHELQDDAEPMAKGLDLRSQSFHVPSVEPGTGRREMKIENVMVDLVADAETLASTSPAFSPPSPAASRASRRTQTSDDLLTQSLHGFGSEYGRRARNHERDASADSQIGLHGQKPTVSAMQKRVSSEIADTERFADAEDPDQSMHSSMTESDIQPGDDNISWGSRRSQTSAPADDVWNSQAADDLPDSLILGTAPVPRPSQMANPPSERTRRPVSPYGRSLQSPGSWPRLDGSPQRHHTSQSPGSWPALDQSQHSMYQPLVPGPVEEIAEATDNKRSAAEASSIPSPALASELSSSQGSPPGTVGDMAESRMFSHEEAESIYMSVMTEAPPTYMPGAWESQSVDHGPQSSETAPENSRPAEASQRMGEPEVAQELLATLPTLPGSGVATPRAVSPDVTRSSPHDQAPTAPQTFLRLLSIDKAAVSIATGAEASAASPSATAADPPSPRRKPPTTFHVGMPGTFSAYSEMTSSHRRGASFASDVASSSAFEPQQSAQDAESKRPSIDLQVGEVRLRFDLAVLQMLYSASRTISAGSANTQATTRSPATSQATSASMPSLHMTTKSLQLDVWEKLLSETGTSAHDSPPSLAALTCNGLKVDGDNDKHDIRLNTVALAVGPTTVLSFDQAAESMGSTVVVQDDVSVTLASRTSAAGPVITELGIQVRPIKLELDFAALEETLGSYGGLSGILDIGSSVMAERSPVASPAARRPSRVRFEDQTEPADSSDELKINARLGGLSVVVRGEESAVALKTSTVKAVHRATGSTARIDHIWLSGPYTAESAEAPASVDLAGLQLFFLNSPQEQDLERLLTLLTPSKDKYDNDDDILIDTLLRQRRKAACLRLEVQDVKAKITDWQCLQHLEKLGQEVSSLSAVTKYIPEDDRPGLLTMVKVGSAEARLPVNPRFGVLQATCTDIHCAHVPLPALFAISFSNVSATQLDGPQILHPLVSGAASDNLPMIMARMLGGEIEPTAKVKLYNVCLEYSVPMLLDLMGPDAAGEQEQIVTKLAASVADLAVGADVITSPHRVNSDRSDSDKKTKIDVLMHSSAIGLSPQNAPSKALLIFTDAKLTTPVPPEDNTQVAFDIAEAGIMITDRARATEPETSIPRRNPPSNPKIAPRVLNSLWRQGYASIGSLAKASIETLVKKEDDGMSNTVEVEVSNELLLLETCADSTQTMIGVMNGLAPPSAPSKQAKYLTEPMSLDDMMASFTGEDEVVTAEPPPETLFDVDEEPDLDPAELLGASGLDMDDDEPLEVSQASLYGPASGMIGDLDDDEPDSDTPCTETVESLLEDDPFEMPDVPEDMAFSDTTLLKDLKQQCRPAAGDNAVNIGNHKGKTSDLSGGTLGGGSERQVLGTRHRFSAPTARSKDTSAFVSQQKCPFRLRLRNVNATWHLHDGYDWQETRDGLTEAVERAEQRAEERAANRRRSHADFDDGEDLIGDCMFNSVYISIPQHITDPGQIRRGINRQIDDLASESESVPASGASRQTGYSAGGRPARQHHRRRLKFERSQHHKISFQLEGLNADICTLPPDSGELQNTVDVRLKHFEIVDCMPTSTWNRFLLQMPQPGPREISRPMIHLDIQNVKTLADYAATELVLRVTVQPLRLHVDQDALDFITRFFEFKDANAAPPVPPNEQPFLQRVEVETVDLCLDYKPKKVDYIGLRSGHTNEFMNFIILEAANIKLRHAIVYGLHGFEPLHKTLNDIWMPDVKRNQLPTVLAGLAPARSLVNIGTGVANIVTIPVREYKRDGRIVRSVQKGAYQFGKQTASELARFGAKLAIGTQNMLSGTEGLLSPAAASNRHISGSPGSWDDADPDAEDREQRAYSAYADQPLGVLSGLRSARRHLEHDLLTARDAFIAVQGEVMESTTPGGAANAVIKHAPTLVLRPVIGASRAVGTALLGVGNAVDKQNIQRMGDKYKRV